MVENTTNGLTASFVRWAVALIRLMISLTTLDNSVKNVRLSLI